MATLSVGGTTVFDGATLQSGVTIDSATTFPAGHVVGQSFFGEENRGSSIVCSSGSYQDSGLEISHQTTLSSANSYLIFEFYSSMIHQQDASQAFHIDTTMRTVSNSTYTSGESISNATYPTYLYAAAANQYYPLLLRSYCGLASGMGMPATKSSWAAEDTLYFRIFGKRGSGNTYYVHNYSMYHLTVTEVTR